MSGRNGKTSWNGCLYLKEGIIQLHIRIATVLLHESQFKKAKSALDGCHARLQKNDISGFLTQTAILEGAGDISFFLRDGPCFLPLAQSTLFLEFRLNKLSD
jgi:hypothetical protein